MKQTMKEELVEKIRCIVFRTWLKKGVHTEDVDKEISDVLDEYNIRKKVDK